MIRIPKPLPKDKHGNAVKFSAPVRLRSLSGQCVEELPAGAAVLPLILQPLLENAVAHGIQGRPEGGKLTVYGRAEGDQVVITIGNPLAPDGLSRGGHGMALRNIRERLALAFGPRASLLTNNVFAKPGTPINKPCPRANRTMASRSMTSV